MNLLNRLRRNRQSRLFDSLLLMLATTNVLLAQSEESADQLPFRRVHGKHLTIVTDVPSSPAIDELPAVFDAAVPQWCAYFGVSENHVKDWHLTGYLIVSKERFRQAELLPDDLPPFLNGYQRGDKLWLYAQPSEYYTRHLLLHEGAHAFMFNHLGAFGSAWYVEGLAEHFGTHRWSNGNLQMRVMPKRKSEFPFWGRITILKRDRMSGGEQPLENILRYPSETFQNNRAYAWSWGLVAMLDGHPKFQSRFRRLKNYLGNDRSHFARAFRRLFQRDMDELHDAWDFFIANIDYGFDVSEAVISYRPSKPMANGNNRVSVDSKKGWQSSGLQVRKGTRYRLASRGRYVIRKENEEVWWSEPGGVTINYWQGQPLGILQAVIRGESNIGNFSSPVTVGLRKEWTATKTGVLFFRVNEMPGDLSDNHGDVTVSVKRLSEKDG